MLSLFPIFRRPLALGRYETAASLLARHAAQLGIPGAAVLCSDIGVRWSDILSGDPSLLSALAKAANVSFDALSQWSPVRIGREALVGHEPMPPSILSERPTRFCPLCLRDDLADTTLRPDLAVFARSHWHIRCLSVCETHNVVLAEPEPCPDKEGITDFTRWIRPILPGLETWIRQAVPCPRSECDAYLFARLRGDARSVPLLDRMPLSMVVQACEALGKDLIEDAGRSASVDEIHGAQEVRHLGFQTFAEGASGLKAYFDRHLDKLGSHKLSSYGTLVLYGNLCRWLHKRKGEFVDPIRDVIAEHAFANLPLAAGSSVCLRILQERRRHTVWSVSQEFGCRSPMLQTWLQAEGLVTDAPEKISESTMIPDTPAGAAFLDKVRDALTHAQAGRLLKIDWGRLDDLIADGIVRPLFPNITDTGQNAYSRTELTVLLERLLDGRPTETDLWEKGLDYSRATRVANEAHCTFHDVIHLLLSDPKIRTFRDPREDGIRSLYVRDEDVRLRVHFAKLPGLTLLRFAGQTQINLRDVGGLRHKGLIWTERVPHPALKNSIEIVPTASMEIFYNRFISLEELAQLGGCHWIAQQKYLNARGKSPAYNGDTPRSRIYEFDPEVERIAKGRPKRYHPPKIK